VDTSSTNHIVTQSDLNDAVAAINIDTVTSSTSVTVTNSAGTDAVIPLVNVQNNKAGLIDAGSKAFLDSMRLGLITDSSVVDNTGVGENVIFARGDTLFGKRLQAGAGIDIDTDTDSSIIISATGAVSLANNGLSKDGDTTELGQAVGAGGNPGRLLNNREIPLNTFSINFLGAASNRNFTIKPEGNIFLGSGDASNIKPALQLGSALTGFWSAGFGEFSAIANGATIPAYVHLKDAGLGASGLVITDGASPVPVTGRLVVREENISTGSAVNFRVIHDTASFVPTSGSASVTMLHINPVINQTGGANGLSRGIRLAPIMTAAVAAGWRAIEIEAAGAGFYAIKQNGISDTNYLAGKNRFPNLVTQIDTATYKPAVVDAAGNLNRMDGWPVGSGAGITLASGVYTPTLTGVTNITASTAYQCQYLRVGDVVTVSGKVFIDFTSTGLTELGISLPIASSISNDFEVAGTVSTGENSNTPGVILGDATNNRAHLVLQTGSSAGYNFFFTFTYTIF
jgi:hypothetical protein